MLDASVQRCLRLEDLEDTLLQVGFTSCGSEAGHLRTPPPPSWWLSRGGGGIFALMLLKALSFRNKLMFIIAVFRFPPPCYRGMDGQDIPKNALALGSGITFHLLVK